MDTAKTTTVDVFVSHLDSGDTAVLPGESTPRHIIGVWFITKTRNWAVQVEEGAKSRDQIYLFHASDDRKATLIERPGYGPFDRMYEVGDLVCYRYGDRDNQFGVIVGHDDNPFNPTNRAYEIRSATITAYADSTTMRIVEQPKFAAGQRWHCVASNRYATILKVDDDGLICTIQFDDTGTIGRFVLAAPFWMIADDAPGA